MENLTCAIVQCALNMSPKLAIVLLNRINWSDIVVSNRQYFEGSRVNNFCSAVIQRMAWTIGSDAHTQALNQNVIFLISTYGVLRDQLRLIYFHFNGTLCHNCVSLQPRQFIAAQSQNKTLLAVCLCLDSFPFNSRDSKLILNDQTYWSNNFIKIYKYDFLAMANYSFS